MTMMMVAIMFDGANATHPPGYVAVSLFNHRAQGLSIDSSDPNAFDDLGKHLFRIFKCILH